MSEREKRIRELERELARLRAGGDPPPPATSQSPSVAASKKGVGVGRDVQSSVVVTGDLHFNFYASGRGKAALDRDGFVKALRTYIESVQSLFSRTRLWGGGGPSAEAPLNPELSEVFVPLTLRRFQPLSRTEREHFTQLRDPIELARFLGKRSGGDYEKTPELPLEDLLSESRLVAVIGGAGCGKSTLLAWLASSLAKSAETGKPPSFKPPKNGSTPIPLVVEFRYLNQYRELCRRAPAEVIRDPRLPTLDGFLFHHLHQRSGLDSESDFFRRLLEAGDCLVMLDGLDEVTDRKQRGKVRGEVERLVERFPKNSYLVTSREAGYIGEAVLSDDFLRLDVQPLSRDHMETLVGNWCRLAYPKETEASAREIMAAIEQINQLRAHRDLPPLVNSPLMTDMVVSVRWAKNELPRERAKLYEACVEVILEARYLEPDEARDQLAAIGGSIDRKREWLSALAYGMHSGGRASAIVDEPRLRELAAGQIDPDELDALLEGIRLRGGLLDVRGELFQFQHLTFQEFLAARHLVKQRKRELFQLEKRVIDPWWREALLLAYGYAVCDHRAFAADYASWLSGLVGDDVRVAGLELAASAVLEQQSPDRGLRRGLSQKLAAALTDPGVAVKATFRAQAGDALGKLGDPRKGIGVIDGVPDIDWIPIDGGEFWMGDKQDWEGGRRFRFSLEPFRIARHPVTVAQYDAFVQDRGYDKEPLWTKAGWKARKDGSWAGPYSHGAEYETANLPRTGVSWYEAAAFCAWLTRRLRESGKLAPDQEVSLPAEGQWERASRHTDGRRYPWGDQEEAAARCNIAETGVGRPSAVGVFPAGNAECGACDMAGNVWEWCRTKWREYSGRKDYEGYEEWAKGRHADELEGTEGRALRGGSFFLFRNLVRCAARLRHYPDGRYHDLGFRVASSPFTLDSEPSGL